MADPDAALGLGLVADIRHSAERAARALTSAVGSTDPAIAATAAFSLGILLAEQGDAAGARAAYHRAIDSGHAEHASNAAAGLGHLLDPAG